MNLKEPESEDQIFATNQGKNRRCKSNASRGNENALEGLISQEFMRQLDSNFMAQKEERIEGW